MITVDVLTQLPMFHSHEVNIVNQEGSRGKGKNLVQLLFLQSDFQHKRRK
jgi:hypothetical protein